MGEGELAELVDYTVKNQGMLRARLSLSDGATLEVWVQLGQISRVGHDPQMGTPLYLVQNNVMTRLVDYPKELRRKVEPAANGMVR